MDAEQRISRARAGLILSAPFYATLAMSLTVERDDNVTETMATDGKRIVYNDSFVAECSDAELRGVVAHEVAHVANLHHTRRNGRDASKWNEACDYVINPQVMLDGFTLPQGALINARFDGMSAEQVYAILTQKSQGQQRQQRQQGQQGQQGQQRQQESQGQQGQQGKPQPGGVLDAADPADPAAMQAAEMDAKARVIQAGQVAKNAGGAGVMGSRAVDAVKAPVLDWKAVLRRFVDASARHSYAWARPNRRYIAQDMYLPGKVPDGMARLVVIIDTSGSIDRRALTTFLGELQSAVDSAAPECVDVIQCDKKVTAREQFGQGDAIHIQVKGGGGTDMQPALDLCEGASAVIVFTDCEFGRDPADPGVPVLWARWGMSSKVPAWGELVAIPAPV